MRKLRMLPAALCACFVIIAPASHAAPFVSAKGYSITPAPGWRLNRSGMMSTDVIIYTQAAGGFAPNLNVVAVPGLPNQTLEQGKAQIMQMYPRMFTHFKMLKTGYEMVGGQRSLLIIGTYLQGKRPLTLHQNILPKSGKVFTFTSTAPTSMEAKYAPAFAQMIHSVRWSR